MVIGVLGGTGSAGREVTAELRRRGQRAIVLSRSAPPDGEHRRVDVATGEGLGEAMAGLDAVVDVVGPKVPVDGLGQAVRAARAGGVGHWLSLSVVGIGDVPTGYHEAMARREAVVRAGEVPWSVLRATQFHSLLAQVFAAAARRGVLPLLRVPIQPVDGREVGLALCDLAEAEPSGAVTELAGPRVERLDELARAWASAHGVRRLALRVPVAGRGLRAVAAGGLTSDGAARGEATFADWLHRELPAGSPDGAAAEPREKATRWA